jgi:6-pyruvoyltetrahydropterin/6-carboxytetrahydropterin synthase
MGDVGNLTAVRRLQFCCGHRVVGHEGKCANVHGHNYVAFVHVQTKAGDLDTVGRIVDFGVIKELVGTWIDDNWDHGFIYWREDEDLASLYASQWREMKHFQADWNPTAENMANHLLEVSAHLLADNLEVSRVDIWETENCYAYATRSELE